MFRDFEISLGSPKIAVTGQIFCIAQEYITSSKTAHMYQYRYIFRTIEAPPSAGALAAGNLNLGPPHRTSGA